MSFTKPLIRGESESLKKEKRKKNISLKLVTERPMTVLCQI